MEIYKYTVRRKVIVMICTVCAFIILLSSMPTSHKRFNYTIGSSQIKFTSQEESIVPSHVSNSAQLSVQGENIQVTKSQSSSLTPTQANDLPELPHSSVKLSVTFNFTSQLNSIVNVIYDQRIPIFLIEQCILWQMLKPDEQAKLIVRKSRDKLTDPCSRSNSSNLNIYTFGLIQSPKLSNIWPRIKESLGSSNEFRDEVDLQMVPSDTAPKHIIIRSKDTLIHVAIFAQRGNMHMVHAFSDPEKFGIKSDELRIGKYEAAFELITPSPVQLNGKFILIPQNKLGYLFELPHSQFLECRHDLAKKWRANYSLTQEVTKRLNETLKVMRHLIFDLQVPIWMDGGSLLGWARHCSGKML